MSARRAFTLIEIMVALVVTGLVVALAYATAQAGFDTGSRLARVQAGTESEAVARAMISNALRHSVTGLRGSGNVFELAVEQANGVTSDVLRFQTRGIVEPFGASGIWQVTIAPTASGLRIAARPLDAGDGAVVVADLPGLRAIDVRVRSSDARRGWLDEWNDPERSPAAVSMAFIGADGRPRGVPLVSRVGLEVTP